MSFQMLGMLVGSQTSQLVTWARSDLGVWVPLETPIVWIVRAGECSNTGPNFGQDGLSSPREAEVVMRVQAQDLLAPGSVCWHAVLVVAVVGIGLQLVSVPRQPRVVKRDQFVENVDRWQRQGVAVCLGRS